MKFKNTIIMTLTFTAFVIVTVVGAFAISFERQNKAETSRRIISYEKKIQQLRRDNDALSVKIAEHETPSHLSRRASARLVRPQMAAVVWGYENYNGGRIEFSNRSKGLVSFKAPESNNTATANR